MERVFAKDIVVSQNSRSFVYAEYPQRVKTKVKKIVPDMWIKWTEDTEQDLRNMFAHEFESNEFDPIKILRRHSEEDQECCLEALKGEMRHILILQRELLVNSS